MADRDTPSRPSTLRAYRTLMSFGFGAAPLQSTLFLFFGVLMALGVPIGSLGSKLLVDAVLAQDYTRGLLSAAMLAAVAAGELIVVLYYVDTLFSVAEKAGAAIDRRLIELMAGVPGIEHHERPEYLDQLDVLREERARLAWMTNATAGMVRVAVQLVASGILLAGLDPILLLLPLVGIVSFFTGRRAQDLTIAARERTAERERLRHHLFETATSAVAGKEVRVFGLERELLDRHHATSTEVMRARDGAEWRAAALQAVGGLASGAGYVGAVALVLVRAIHGTDTPGDVVLAVGLAAGMNSLVTTAVLYGTAFLRILQLARRYLWLVDFATTQGKSPPVIGEPAPIPNRLDHGIDLRNITFRYPGTEKTVLEDVSLHLPAGSVVALVGENGAGKTTLVKLLCRFYEPDAGTIELDGIDLRALPMGNGAGPHREESDAHDMDGWRSRISTGFQDFARLELLAKETVGVGELPHLEDRELVGTALTRAGARDLPEQLPSGLDTQLGRAWDGVELSGGQWQKLALGRAMMRQAPLLLILDEPTASLDAQTEHELFERYTAAARRAGAEAGTITLLVTHRFSTVRMADRIVVLEGANIREQGSHQELMARNGLYAELYELQARQYR